MTKLKEETVKKRLRVVRAVRREVKALNLSNSEFAQLSGLSESNLSKWFTEHCMPTGKHWETIQKIHDEFREDKKRRATNGQSPQGSVPLATPRPHSGPAYLPLAASEASQPFTISAYGFTVTITPKGVEICKSEQHSQSE